MGFRIPGQGRGRTHEPCRGVEGGRAHALTSAARDPVERHVRAISPPFGRNLPAGGGT